MPRGGSRIGAGRKPGSIERTTALRIAAPLIQGMAAKEAVSAAAILASVDERALWLEELGNPKHRLAALMYLTDKRDGKARQAVELKQDETCSNLERIVELVALAKARADAAFSAELGVE